MYRYQMKKSNYFNKIVSQLLSTQFATSSEGLYAFQIYQFPTGTLDGTFTNINTHSVLQENTTFTTAAAGGTLLWETPIAIPSGGTGVSAVSLNFDRQTFYAHNGEEFGIYKVELVAGAGNDTTFWSIGYVDLY